MDPDGRVIYVGTLSKVLSPGLRIGYVAADHAILAKLNLCKQAADLCSSTLSQRLACVFLDDPRSIALLDAQRDVYRARRDALAGALATELPVGSSWTTPEGGLFLWATLPRGLDSDDLLVRCLSRQVAFVPGRAAYLDGQGARSLRLNFSAVDEDMLREGARRLGAVCGEALELAGALEPARAHAPRTRMTIGVLRGGWSLERSVSLRSGARVEGALRRLGHEPVQLDLDRELAPRLAQRDLAGVIVAVHGAGGDDGAAQGLLEAFGTPYTGSGPAAAAIAFDKPLTKRLFASAGLPTPPFVVVSSDALRDLGLLAVPARPARVARPSRSSSSPRAAARRSASVSRATPTRSRSRSRWRSPTTARRSSSGSSTGATWPSR